MKPEKNIYIIIRESLQPELRHMAIPQTGASVIATNDSEEILLLKKTNGNKWVLPGGVQELGEDFRNVAQRELFEETGINYNKEDLILIDIVSGEGRHKKYPNGDEVYNNSALFHAPNIINNTIDLSGEDYQDNGNGNYIIAIESNDYGWFNKDSLPENVDDIDLIKTYLDYLKRKEKKQDEKI